MLSKVSHLRGAKNYITNQRNGFAVLHCAKPRWGGARANLKGKYAKDRFCSAIGTGLLSLMNGYEKKKRIVTVSIRKYRIKHRNIHLHLVYLIFGDRSLIP